MAENISVFGLLVVPDLSYRLFLRLEGAMDSYSSMLDVCGFSFGNCNSPPPLVHCLRAVNLYRREYEMKSIWASWLE